MPDAVGNLFKTQHRNDRQYGPAGQLLVAQTPQGWIQYKYDPEGNLIEKLEPDGRLWRYEWNGAGMLTKVVRPDGSDPHQLIDLGPGRYSQMIWSPSPTGWPLLVGFYGEDQPKTLHYVAGDGQVPAYLGAFSWGPIWSPDGSRLVFGYNQRLDPDNFVYQSDFCVFEVQPDFWP